MSQAEWFASDTTHAAAPSPCATAVITSRLVRMPASYPP